KATGVDCSLLEQLTRRLAAATPYGGSEEMIHELQGNAGWHMGEERGVLVHGERPPWSAVNPPSGAVSAAEFRAMLKNLGARLSLGCGGKGKGKGYEVAKLRAEATVAGLCVESSSKATS